MTCSQKHHKVAESAEIGHKVAESANLTNGFYPLLKCSYRLATDHLLSSIHRCERENRLNKLSGRAINVPSGHFMP
jgi:hypothetical protein